MQVSGVTSWHDPIQRATPDLTILLSIIYLLRLLSVETRGGDRRLPSRPILGTDPELLQLAVQRAAFHSNEASRPADIAAKAQKLCL